MTKVVVRTSGSELTEDLRRFGVKRASDGSGGMIHFAQPGQALTLRQPHRRFGTCLAEFVGQAGNGRDIIVRKLIAGMWTARWTKPMRIARTEVLAVHDRQAREG